MLVPKTCLNIYFLTYSARSICDNSWRFVVNRETAEILLKSEITKKVYTETFLRNTIEFLMKLNNDEIKLLMTFLHLVFCLFLDQEYIRKRGDVELLVT